MRMCAGGRLKQLKKAEQTKAPIPASGGFGSAVEIAQLSHQAAAAVLHKGERTRTCVPLNPIF